MHTQLRQFDTSLTLRLAASERQRLDTEAKKFDLSTAAYVRSLIATEQVQRKLAASFERRQQRAEYAHILRLLGQSRIANNLNQIAYAMNTGTFIFTPDVAAQINEAYESVLYIRSLLIQSQGLKVQ
jgi:hypothetical protein